MVPMSQSQKHSVVLIGNLEGRLLARDVRYNGSVGCMGKGEAGHRRALLPYHRWRCAGISKKKNLSKEMIHGGTGELLGVTVGW
jgi:hypothetical protein